MPHEFSNGLLDFARKPLRQINAEAYRRAQCRQKRAEYRNMENHSEPGEPAPQQGHYLAHNVFGSPSMPRWVVWCESGETLPVSGRGYTWRLVGKIDEPVDTATDRARRLVPADTHASSPRKLGLSHKLQFSWEGDQGAVTRQPGDLPSTVDGRLRSR